MMTFNVAVGILVFVVCLVLLTSIAVFIKVQEVHQQCIGLLDCVYDWLEKARQEQEVNNHEGTE